jgi:hypothetical protein
VVDQQRDEGRGESCERSIYRVNRHTIRNHDEG